MEGGVGGGFKMSNNILLMLVCKFFNQYWAAYIEFLTWNSFYHKSLEAYPQKQLNMLQYSISIVVTMPKELNDSIALKNNRIFFSTLINNNMDQLTDYLINSNIGNSFLLLSWWTLLPRLVLLLPPNSIPWDITLKSKFTVLYGGHFIVFVKQCSF